MQRRLIIAGTGSGVGKTTWTIGLMAALRGRGNVVQGFKCGPDYIDPSYHTAVTGRPSRNLDSWMMGERAVREAFIKGSEGADISIIEGVMGLFDGKSALSNESSTAHIGEILETPILLVVNVQSMGRSAAAIVRGFQQFAEGVRIAGVIANNAGSGGHYQLVKDAVEQMCGIPVVGWMDRDAQLSIPERHLGLVPSIERGEMDAYITRLGERVAENLELDRVLQLAECPDLAPAQPLVDATLVPPLSIASALVAPRVRVAVARDAAFHFYYPDNLELLERCGAELAYFSPLAGEPVPPDADGLYIGGGFPEEFAERLAGQHAGKQAVRRAIEDGMPTLAECGGFMYLTESIRDTRGQEYAMVGLIAGQCRMQTKYAAMGYREVKGQPGNFLLNEGESARGHEFHYSAFHPAGDLALSPAYVSESRWGTKPEGYLTPNLVAGYTHLHFASRPELADRWVAACARYRNIRRGRATEVVPAFDDRVQ